MFLLRCTDALRSDDGRGPLTLLCKVVRRTDTPPARLHAVEYAVVNWLDLHRTYVPAGPLALTCYPEGGGVALTVSDYGIGGSIRGPALIDMKVHEASFDPSPFLGRVLVAEGRDGVRLYDPYASRPVSWIPEYAYGLLLAQLGLSASLIDCLAPEGIRTAADLCFRSPAELLEMRNVGDQHVREVQERLAEVGLRLPEGR